MDMIQQGLRITRSLSYLPGAQYDDGDRWITISEACRGTRLNPATLRSLCIQKKIKAVKESFETCGIPDGCWKISLRSFARWLDRYRYDGFALTARAGRRWSLKEIASLFSDRPLRDLARKLGRSENSVRKMRCMLGLPHAGEPFERPFFVTPHAVERFRERVCPRIPTRYVQWLVQDGLQRAEMVDVSRHSGATWACRGRVRALDFRAVVVHEDGREWPMVVTVMESAERNRIARGRRAERRWM